MEEILKKIETFMATEKRAHHGMVFRPQMLCADGFKMSVQASSRHYCTPRQDAGPYTAVEVGFPSARDERLMEYAESPEDPTGTVYGWVPVERLAEVIIAHGGLVGPAPDPVE